MLKEDLILFTDLSASKQLALFQLHTKSKEKKELLRSEPNAHLELCFNNKDTYVALATAHQSTIYLYNHSLQPIYQSDRSDLFKMICLSNELLFIKDVTAYQLQDINDSSAKDKDMANSSTKESTEGGKEEQQGINNEINEEKNNSTATNKPDQGDQSKDNPFFIQRKIKGASKDKFHRLEVAHLNLKNKEITIVSDLQAVTQLIMMDDKILVPFNGEYYMLRGEHNLERDNLNIHP